MNDIENVFKKDEDGLYYFNINDFKLDEFNFNEVKVPFSPKRKFYYISGIDNYIVKDTTNLPIFFNGYQNKKLLKNFKINQNKFNDIDFPIGYMLEKKKLKGMIVPYYKQSLSVKELTNLYKFEDLKKYYLHDENDVHNLIEMCLEILKLIKHMYDENIIYVDIGAGNFLVYNNSIKIVDFEPGRVYFKEKKKRYLSMLLSYYNILVNYIWRHFGFQDMPYSPGETFIDAEYKVKALYNEKRG